MHTKTLENMFLYIHKNIKNVFNVFVLDHYASKISVLLKWSLVWTFCLAVVSANSGVSQQRQRPKSDGS